MMKSAVFLLGALAAKCPLNAKCKSLTMSESLKGRYTDAKILFKNGVKNDFLFRAGDQVAWDVKCRGRTQVPFAVATSNGLFVRIMKKRRSPWLVTTLPVAEFGKLGCQNFKKLEHLDPETVVPTLKEQEKSCGKDCQFYPAKMLLYPDATWVTNLPNEDARNLFTDLSYSVSSLSKGQRERLDEAKVATFKCKRQQRVAWGDNFTKRHQVLVIRKRATRNGLRKLVKVTWDKRCN